jgi:hypothetical protein
VHEGEDFTTFIVSKVKKIGSLNRPEPLGPPRPVAGHLYLLLDGGGWLRPNTGRLTPGNDTGYLFYCRMCGPEGRFRGGRKVTSRNLK